MTFTRFAVLTATAAFFSTNVFAQLPMSKVLTMDAAQAIEDRAPVLTPIQPRVAVPA